MYKKKNVEEKKSVEKLEARIRQAQKTHAIGIHMTGINVNPAVEQRLLELKAKGRLKIEKGSPVVCYFLQ